MANLNTPPPCQPTYLGEHLGEASHPAQGESDRHEDRREDDMLERPM